ncbi:MAG: hypothetical protein PHD95_01380 [Candidatus ainarchaeum sp.]|nr:hypothetical protein [Candidatus ainarchaeum sp.]
MFGSKFILSVIRGITESILVQLIIAFLVLSGAAYVFKDSLGLAIAIIGNTTIPLGQALLVLFFTVFVVLLIVFIRNRQRKGNFYIAGVPLHGGIARENEHSFEFDGMKWIAYVPINFDNLFPREEYVRLTGPFCPQCFVELKFNKSLLSKSWFCENCKRKFKVRKSDVEHRQFVEERCYADWFRKNKFA